MDSQVLLLWLLILGLVFGVLGYIYYKNLDVLKVKTKKTGRRAKENWSLE
jgi:hypothetical protein